MAARCSHVIRVPHRSFFLRSGHCCTRPLCKVQTRLATSWQWVNGPTLHCSSATLSPYSVRACWPAAHRLAGLVTTCVKESMNCWGLRAQHLHRGSQLTQLVFPLLPCRSTEHEAMRYRVRLSGQDETSVTNASKEAFPDRRSGNALLTMPTADGLDKPLSSNIPSLLHRPQPSLECRFCLESTPPGIRKVKIWDAAHACV